MFTIRFLIFFLNSSERLRECRVEKIQSCRKGVDVFCL